MHNYSELKVAILLTSEVDQGEEIEASFFFFFS